jgi:hypothetical protein
MSHEATTDRPADAAALFSADEVAALHRDDIRAGKGVVLVMCSVFVLGLVLYSIIAWICSKA